MAATYAQVVAGNRVNNGSISNTTKPIIDKPKQACEYGSLVPVDPIGSTQARIPIRGIYEISTRAYWGTKGALARFIHELGMNCGCVMQFICMVRSHEYRNLMTWVAISRTDIPLYDGKLPKGLTNLFKPTRYTSVRCLYKKVRGVPVGEVLCLLCRPVITQEDVQNLISYYSY